MSENIYSVSELNNFIKGILEQRTERVMQVVGEISNFKKISFQALLFYFKRCWWSFKCVMFRSRAVSLRFEPHNGDTVVAGPHWRYMNVMVCINYILIYYYSRA